EETDSGRDIVGAGAVEIDGRGDLGLLRLARDRRLALHVNHSAACRFPNRRLRFAASLSKIRPSLYQLAAVKAKVEQAEMDTRAGKPQNLCFGLQLTGKSLTDAYL